MCNANATGHRIGSKTPTKYHVKCTTTEGATLFTFNRRIEVRIICPGCGDYIRLKEQWHTGHADALHDSNGRIVEAS